MRPPPAKLYPALVFPHKNNVDLPERLQSRVMEMVTGLDHFSCGVRLRELGLEKRRLWGDLYANLQFLRGAYKKDGDKLLDGHKLFSGA